jgi:neutral trehalase
VVRLTLASKHFDSMNFQNYPITTPELVEVLRAGLSCIRASETPYPSNEEYTRTVRESLACAAGGGGRKFEAYPDKCKGNRECGYDVSWWTETEDQLELVLAVESEWDERGVKYDFEKILAAKCPLKLVITDSHGNVERMKSLLERSLRRYQHHVTGERYVWVDVEGTYRGGHLRPFKCQIESDGPNKSLLFEEAGGPTPYTFL